MRWLSTFTVGTPTIIVDNEVVEKSGLAKTGSAGAAPTPMLTIRLRLLQSVVISVLEERGDAILLSGSYAVHPQNAC